MVCLKISGRTGNQLFQYAYVQKYIDYHWHDEILNISFEYLDKQKTDDKTFINELKHFNIKEVNYIDKIEYDLKQKVLDKIYVYWNRIIRFKVKLLKRNICEKDYFIMKKVYSKILNKNGLYYYFPGVKDFFESKKKNIIFFGTFEDASYMKRYEDDIVNFFNPKAEITSKNEKLMDNIKNSESVCVTIRRGDFLNNQFKKNYYICNEEYFEKAIKRMKEEIPEAKFIIFSDDIEWCKQNLKVPEDSLFENDYNNIPEKILLMSSCKHFILSNSTFSWWCQFLSRNKNKKVIAPAIWNKYEYNDSLYLDDWILM